MILKKNLQKIHKLPLDKSKKVCYNISTVKQKENDVMEITITPAKNKYSRFRDLNRGDVFIPLNTNIVCIKSFMPENGKTKAVNLKSGEIINMSLDKYVIPVNNITLNVINKP